MSDKQKRPPAIRYVVAVERRNRDKGDRVYLVAINYDPYQRKTGAERNSVFTEDPSVAFRFYELAAAEMAAVTVGGAVMYLHRARADYKRANPENPQ